MAIRSVTSLAVTACVAALALPSVDVAASPAFAAAATPAPQIRARDAGGNESKDSTLARLAQLVTVVGLPIGVYQLLRARFNERSLKTADFAKRYSEQTFQSVASRVVSFLATSDAADCVARLEAYERRAHADDPCLPRSASRPHGPKASINDLFQILYFFEDLAAAYNRRQLSARVVHDTFAVTPVQFFTAGWWYICWRRQGDWVGRQPVGLRRWRPFNEALRGTDETDLYAHFEWMVKQLRRRLGRLRSSDSPATAGLVLCLPPRSARRQPRAWAQARHYSRILSRPEVDVPGVVSALESAWGVAPRDPRPWVTSDRSWEVVIVPPSIDEARHEWQWRRALAGRLAHYLTKRTQAEIEAALSYSP